MKKLILIALVVALVAAATASVAGKKDQADLRNIETLYVGSMGQGDAAERLQLVLPAYLIDSGFQVAEEKASADAELTGVLLIKKSSIPLPDPTGTGRSTPATEMRIDLELKSMDGKVLWSRQVVPHAKEGDPLQSCADQIVKRLSKATKRKGRP